MKFSRDTMRTILALLLIVIIVVATFAYGNSQRNKQQADNKAKVEETQTKQETANNEKSATTDANSGTNNSSTATTNDSSSTTTNTASTPHTGGSAQPLPETGAEASYGIPLAIVALVGYFYLRSRQSLSFAQSK